MPKEGEREKERKKEREKERKDGWMEESWRQIERERELKLNERE